MSFDGLPDMPAKGSDAAEALEAMAKLQARGRLTSVREIASWLGWELRRVETALTAARERGFLK
jgi:hypothetical protein